ncbi:MAG: DUF115 domain-containing protein, partial [Phycisphaerae bacterium]|nr:DUF115 domain-containing protein [Phycisphaerae bacterium]
NAMQATLSEEDVRLQSLAAIAQSGDKWRKHAKLNGEIYKRNKQTYHDLFSKEYGRQVIVCGMGKSLEDKIPELQQYANRVDILCCDKAFKILMDHGIKPKYVFLADANISYDEWIANAIYASDGVTLIMSICANPEWARNWKGPIYFFVNKDNIKSEDIFIKISGCPDIIPASSNVGNTAVVYATQILGYREVLLVGYDFSWEPDGNYYAFADKDKRFWMRHFQLTDINGGLAFTSGNLMFSCRWLQDYYYGPLSVAGVRMFNCSGRGILRIPQHEIGKRVEKFVVEYPSREVELKKKLFRSKTLTITADNGGWDRLKNVFAENEVLNVQVTYAPKQTLAVNFA